MSKQFNQRATTGDDFSNRQKDGEFADEVKKLIKEGKSDATVWQKLKRKYPDDDTVSTIFQAYKERLAYITKKSKRFKQLIIDKYGAQNLPLDRLMMKAKKYSQKYELSDDEFNMFVNLVLSDKMASPHYQIPTTPMARLLGYEAAMSITEKLNVKDNELDTVQEILRLYGESRALHAQIVIQSLTYRDCAPEALVGKYDYGKHNVYSYVHPIVAALFLPRINLLDEQMLIANLGYIVKSKHDGTTIATKPDFELYWSLIHDPNERACSISSPIKDIKNRYLLQTKLWDSVLNLRQGRYYHENLNDFLLAIDNCRQNIYDAPDLTYVKDEGSILRRLLSAFAIRPTIVSTTRLYNVLGGSATYGYNPVANAGPAVTFGQDPISAAGITDVTTVSLITLRLPLSVSTVTGQQAQAVSLEQALSQPQMFVENRMIVPKAQTIMHSRDVLFFYVGRRFQTINITRLNSPCNFTSLPMTVAGWEQLNDKIVNFEMRMNILGDTFQLRSVVLVESSPSRRNLIIGSSAGIVVPMNVAENRFEETFLLYDPQGAGEKFRDGDKYVSNNPITYIPSHTPFNNESSPESFYKRASTRGTIFMYQKVSDGRPCVQL
jgi:hypothetical protein